MKNQHRGTPEMTRTQDLGVAEILKIKNFPILVILSSFKKPKSKGYQEMHCNIKISCKSRKYDDYLYFVHRDLLENGCGRFCENSNFGILGSFLDGRIVENKQKLPFVHIKQVLKFGEDDIDHIRKKKG